MFDKVLIANRGEIAVRILRTLRRLNVRSVAVFSDSDRHAPHVLGADESIALGPGPASETYLRQDKLLAAAARTGAQAVHPGYGFLSENAAFAEACATAGVVFIGPTPLQMRDFGLKHRARELAARSGVSLLPGSGLLGSIEEAGAAAARIGYPLMLKSTAGGGGIGMQLIRAESQLPSAFEAVERLAAKNFNSSGVFLEKYIERARHIEVQIFGDGLGTVIALGERDCSSQRRNQKIIEETPAPHLSAASRADMFAASVRLGEAVTYQSAGTVEFVYDVATQEFYFLEVNTRLQVEHGVTEEVTGIDLVEWMIRQAAGEGPPLQAPVPQGAAIEVRVYAEDPARAYRPSSGLITEAQFSAQARNESWVESGTQVTPLYDPLLAKIITAGKDRADALLNMRKALAETRLAGIETNLDYLKQLIASELFAGGGMTTRALEQFVYLPRTVEVLSGGTQSTLQDYPGRVGFWNVGVPPSGPMDDWSFRLGNQALGNKPSAVALEMTLSGAALKFNCDAWVCLTGAQMSVDVDGTQPGYWAPFQIRAGQTLRLGDIQGEGCRTYLCVQHGFQVPHYLGSGSTFTLGKFGGHGGRALGAGDVLHIAKAAAGKVPAPTLRRTIPPAVRPVLRSSWEIGVLDGPHGAPDFFTRDDIETFYAGTWEVHYNSSRTGVRLIGAKPAWARSDGGEAGLHPSNIHDNAYAIGAVDFTGDMPVILGPDGPSLGGFVCPVTVVKSELWKLGQLRPNNRVQFRRMTPDEAGFAEADQTNRLETLQDISAKRVTARGKRVTTAGNGPDAAIVASLAPRHSRPAVVYRRAGDRYMLVEYGPLVLDLELRLRVHALMTWLNAVKPEGIIELTPGIRSLQVHYDSRILPLDSLLDLLVGGEEALPAIDAMEIPTRVVRLPLSWDDAATQLAIDKYMQSVRADAPWCPSNIEFIRRINGLESVEQVKHIVYEASYLVMGLGDVYLGAPVCTPLDPRHRLVTTKYNPARTWTPENAVGIGGAYLCVYGMEGPGGYQFVGRTCQMWNTYRVSAEFTNDEPWLLRFFDQVRFFPVSNAELTEFRRDFLYGRTRLEIREEVFRLAEYRAFLSANAHSITAAKARQQSAFEAERRAWEASGQIGYTAELPPVFEDHGEERLESGQVPVVSPVSGSVWRVAAAVGQRVKAGETLVLIESMKMELPVAAPMDGVVRQLRCAEGRAVHVAQTLLILEPFESRAQITGRAPLGD